MVDHHPLDLRRVDVGRTPEDHLGPSAPYDQLTVLIDAAQVASVKDSASQGLGGGLRSAEALRGGVLHTGDLGFVDEDGQLVIQGRRTEMILRGGANVYPAEVERVMVDHPGVREVAVFGIPDERLGELVAAGLVAEAGPWASGDPDLLVEDVRSFCRERLAHYKVCLLYTSPSPRDATLSRMPSSA